MVMSSDHESSDIDRSKWGRSLLFGSAGAFASGLAGAIWYTKRRQAKHDTLVSEVLEHNQKHHGTNTIPDYQAPKMTPEELEIAKKQARFFAVKTLGLGTLLAFTGAGVLAVGVGYWLDVRNFQEFSDKLHVIIPERTSKLRRWLGGKELAITKQEEKELDDFWQTPSDDQTSSTSSDN
ncbi:hypothetical protein BC940DRAFT_313569 [Gongronella butleri]|nr:hypothetical protein BC940DRAFT_313569 [Gongronella butleri]